MASARTAETQHPAVPHRLSPLAGVARGGELSLLRFTAAAADEFIQAFVDRFAAPRRKGRARQRSGLTIDDFYTLLTYGRGPWSGRCDPAMTASSAAGWSRHEDKSERVWTVCQVVATADGDWHPELACEGLTVAQACELAEELGPRRSAGA